MHRLTEANLYNTIGQKMKKNDQPYMPFYIGDWKKAPEIRALSLAARGLWVEMLFLMWESTERGYLTINGVPMTTEVLSRQVGFACDLLDGLLAELLQFNVYSIRDDGAIFCRRMVRDAEISLKRAIAGRKGGICSTICSSKSSSKMEANADNDTDNESVNKLSVNQLPNTMDSKISQSKKVAIDIPDAIRESFTGWCESRKVKPTQRAKELALKKLNELYPGNFEKQRQCLDQSTMNGWQGIFPIKTDIKKHDDFSGYKVLNG